MSSLIYFGSYGTAEVVDSSRFTNVLLRANFATYEINAAVCAARLVAKVVGATRVGVVLAQKASGIRTYFKTTIWQRVVYYRIYIHSTTFVKQWSLHFAAP